MFIRKAHILAPIISLTIFAFTSSATGMQTNTSSHNNFKGLVYDTPTIRPDLQALRPVTTDKNHINDTANLTRIKETGDRVSGCLYTQPYSSKPVMEHIGDAINITANHSARNIEQLSFQPYFSGLKGPKLTIMRKDIENSLIHNRGSANEIYHNAIISEPSATACDTTIKTHWDIELDHQIDMSDSDNPPLIRSDITINNHINFGGYFLATASITTPLYDNFHKDSDLLILDRSDPIGQDEEGFVRQSMNISRLMLSGFATPSSGLYMAAHAGYLEERFFGIGGELLYRPFGKSWGIGAEFWTTRKRIPYLGESLKIDEDNRQVSSLLNLSYDAPIAPYSLGLSLGRFLDGDEGAELRARYTPHQGWNIETFLKTTNQKDRSLDNDKEANFAAGLRLSMPLGNLKYLPDNSRQTFEISPFARDKGQRINNAHNLYDITNPWQAKNLHREWSKIIE